MLQSMLSVEYNIKLYFNGIQQKYSKMLKFKCLKINQIGYHQIKIKINYFTLKYYIFTKVKYI